MSVVVYPAPGPLPADMGPQSLALAHSAVPEDFDGPGDCHALALADGCFDELLDWVRSRREVEACIELLVAMPNGWRWLNQMDERWTVRWNVCTEHEWGPVMVLQLVPPEPAVRPCVN